MNTLTKLNKLQTVQFNRRLTILALMVALGIVLSRLETLIPLPSPWIKLGLPNIMTLITMVFLGFRDALIVTTLRVILSSIFLGTFLSPTFFLSLSGGVTATLAMAVVYYYRKNPFSLVGVSILGAYAHTVAVTLCVYTFWIQQDFFFKLLPIFFIFSLTTGILNGLIGNFIITKLIEEKTSFA